MIVKRQFGYAKVAYRGIAKNMNRFHILFASANLVMCAGDDPVRAVGTLKDYIVHTHAKDGLRLQEFDPRGLYCPNYYGVDPVPWDVIREVPLGEGGVRWNDPQIGVDWRLEHYGIRPEELLLSDKDRVQPLLSEL